MEDEKPWQSPPIPAGEFHTPGKWTNINRAPYDIISGVLYKQAINSKCVEYQPLDPTPDMPDPWKGSGKTSIRWLFSEMDGTEEHILNGTEFIALLDTKIKPNASSGHRRHTGEVHILYTISGQGTLYHRACSGCPVISRPLRTGDAAVVQGTELYSIENHDEHLDFRLLILKLRIP
ncbi:MAG: cupin domain-containing protein [Anaerolineae bacterium]|nr:cupin domain-containing protein [Anaerolineae bacterium]